MPLILPARTLDSGYEIDNSLRYNNPDDPSLAITFGSAGNRKTFTISAWVKRSNFLDNNTIFGQGASSPNPRGLLFFADQRLRITNNNSGSGNNDMDIETNALYRDPSAWYHIVVAIDVTQSTDTNRMKMYVNGQLQTSFNNATYPAQNTDLNWNNSVLHTVGRYPASDSQHFDGYISEFYFIDGTQYAASNFGEYNDNGVWIPKDAKDDLTFGSNGFYLEMKQSGTGTNSSGMGADTSGNDNHLAVSNLAATDVTTDTPTNNFATFNPIDVGTNLANCTFSEGNCKVVKSGTTSSNGDQVVGSMAFTQGKWYWEIKGVSNNENLFIGVFNDVLGGIKPYHNNYFYAFYGDGNGSNSQIYESQESAQKGYGIDNSTCFSDNDIIQIAFDADNFRLYIGRNGSWTDDNAASGGTITSGSGFNESTPTGYYQISTSAAQSGFWRAGIVVAGSSVNFTSEINFGNPPFSISSGNADANGYGNFEYAVPSGYYALCTKNLAEYG